MNSINTLFEKKKFTESYFILVVLSFILGFFLNEDSSGGGLVDFEHEWTSIQEFKLGIISALTSEKYESSRTPLFLILNYFNPFNYSEYSYRLSNFVFNLFIPFTFFYFLKKKYDYLNVQTILIISSFMFLSPYFRTSSFWAHQENLPILFSIISLLYLNEYTKKNLHSNFYNIFFIAIISSLAFYSDQKYIFISLVCYITLLRYHKFEIKYFFYISFLFFLTSIPMLYLFKIWQGIVPVQSQFRIGFYPENIFLSISIITFYFIPIFVCILFNKKFIDLIKSIKFADFIFIFFVITSFIFLLPEFSDPWGGGAMFKLVYVINLLIDSNLISKLIFYISVSLMFILTYLLLKNNLINFLPLFIIIFLTSLVEKTYQEYFDPIIIVLLFSYFTFEQNIIEIRSKNVVKSYLIFFLCFLVLANLYYVNYNLVK